MNKGFVVNLETRHRQPGRYRLTDQEIEAEPLLPSVEEIRAYQALSAERGAKTAQTCKRTPKDEEDHGDSVCTDDCGTDAVCANDDADANGSCKRQDTEKTDEKPTVCTYARKPDPIPGGGKDRPVQQPEG